MNWSQTFSAMEPMLYTAANMNCEDHADNAVNIQDETAT